MNAPNPSPKCPDCIDRELTPTAYPCCSCLHAWDYAIQDNYRLDRASHAAAVGLAAFHAAMNSGADVGTAWQAKHDAEAQARVAPIAAIRADQGVD